MTRRIFLLLSVIASSCRRAPKESPNPASESRHSKSFDNDPWSQPRTRIYDRDLLKYAAADVEASMRLMQLHNEINPSHREYWVIRSEKEDAAIRSLRRQAQLDGYTDIGGGVWERRVR